MDSASSISSWVLAVVRYQAKLSYMIIDLTQESLLAPVDSRFPEIDLLTTCPVSGSVSFGLPGPLIGAGSVIRGR